MQQHREISPTGPPPSRDASVGTTQMELGKLSPIGDQYRMSDKYNEQKVLTSFFAYIGIF